MLNRYRVKILKRYDFELDGKSEEDVRRQASYVMNKTKILDMPYVKKKCVIKVQESKDGNNEENS